MTEQIERPGNRLHAWLICGLAGLIVYVLSSGPVIGLGFWLREATGWDGFYAVMWLYLPLLMLDWGNPMHAYIEWWVVDVFHTVGPG